MTAIRVGKEGFSMLPGPECDTDDALADQRVFVLDDRQWAELTAVLAAPPRENPGLRALLARKPAWEG